MTQLYLLYVGFFSITAERVLYMKHAMCLLLQVLVSGQALGDDLYLEEQQSGDFPVDDDDFSSGSGSGKPQIL